MANSWKSFDFFEVSQARPGDDETRSYFEGNEIASVCCGSDSLFLGGVDGHVRIIGPSWKVVRTFLAYDQDQGGGGGRGSGSITHMRQVEGTSLLVTVAEDVKGADDPVLKVWALDRPVKKTGLPTCLSTVQIMNGSKQQQHQHHQQFPISAFTATDDLSQVAAGFANGTVTLIRGDLINDTGTRQRIIHESEEPITGVAIGVDAGFDTTVFVATTGRLLSIRLAAAAKGKPAPPKTVEDSGCAVGCMAEDRRTGDIVVARDDAFYYYTLDGRGPPRAYDAPKSLVAVYGDYTAVVSPVQQFTNNRSSAGTADVLFNSSTFALLETDLRVVAHSETLLSPVKAVFALWGGLCVLTVDGKVQTYREKPLAARLDMLYQRNLYHLAIELARKSGVAGGEQAGIFRRFGDYLYQKGSFDEAMAQYIKAIDSTEPSQVIRKFLDTQRIHNLIAYLEQLHEHHRATADHTTLLLNCYAKLKDIDKLERFIKSEEGAWGGGGGGEGELTFDLDTAIAVCRQGGYYEQAVYLAKQHGEDDLVVDILIEDAQQYAATLDYIWQLDAATAYASLLKYARVLVEHCPQATTQLFIDYYTGQYKPREATATAAVAGGSTATAAAEEAAAGAGGFAYGAVSGLAGLITLPYYGTSGTATPGEAGAVSGGGGGGGGAAAAAAVSAKTTAPAQPTYKIPRPRTAFSSFIDHADEFIVFLEALLEHKDTLSQADRTDVCTTLFEMYLQKAGEKKGEQQREAWEAKAKALIHQGGGNEGEDAAAAAPPIAKANVLLLSHLAKFGAGTTLVKEQAGLLFDIFRSHTSAHDTRGALAALHKYGPEEPQLYPAALAYLTSSAQVLDEAGSDELAAVLQRIHRDGLLAPLQVVQTLSQSPVATMGMLKPYLQETIARERREIAANERRIAAFRHETEQRRAELVDLEGKPAVFQATRCSQCALPLELPVVHFLCKHSFHQRCLKVKSGVDSSSVSISRVSSPTSFHESISTTAGASALAADASTTTECPLCAQDNATVRAIRRQQEEYATRHDLFKTELGNSEDRFSTVADWFQRGVMGGE